MDEKMNEFYFECCQQMLFLWKIEQKKQGSKQFMLVSFKINPQMKCSNHNLNPYFIFLQYEIYSTTKPWACQRNDIQLLPL
jgi:hypothetical protein